MSENFEAGEERISAVKTNAPTQAPSSTSQVNPELAPTFEKNQQENVDLLTRFIDQQIQLKGQNTSSADAVPYSKLLSFATRYEMGMFYLGHFCAVVTGLALPSFSYLMGDVMDSFGGTSREAQLYKVRTVTIIFTVIGAGVWVLSYCYWSLLVIFSLRVSRRIKEKYLEAILKQECAWFDMINYTELSARVARETLAM